MKTIVATFDDLRHVERAVRALLDEPVSHELISMVAAALDDEPEIEAIGDGQSYVSGVFRARSGAAASLAQLLPELAVLTIPDVGTVLASGPLVFTRPTEATRPTHDGLVGDMITAGVPEPDARAYVDCVKRGGAIVMVNAAARRVERLTELLASCEPSSGEPRANLEALAPPLLR